ncbi:hypothetical protein [Acidocella facilis]|uniref:hypothetical protein n=1 Tax=Acidocella facilis TaxID=525 RepID=UPI0012DFCB7D|nr:hypothetical protein [Acidocella facilis]
MIARFKASWGLPVAMSVFIIAGAVLSAIISGFPTRKWLVEGEVEARRAAAYRAICI